MRFVGLLGLGVLVWGCGSGSGRDTQYGSLALTVIWPEPSRLIPAASNSIQAVVTSGAATLGTQRLTRPAQGDQVTTTFPNLPPGAVTLTATAYPQGDGTGVAQARGGAPVTIVGGQTATVTVTMASTIDHLEVAPANPSIPVGQSVQLAMTARDAAESIVLTSPAKVQWQSASTAHAIVNSTGSVTGVAAGTAQITVTETESGKSASTTVAVTGAGPSGRIVFVNTAASRIMWMDDNTGANLNGFGSQGSGSNQFLSPADLAFDSAGRIYIADSGNHRIVRMDDLNGTNWTTFGTQGSGDGQFRSPQSVAIDGFGRIYVTDNLNRRIVRMDNMTGANLTTFGTQGSGVGQFDNPREINLDAAGRIYVMDWFNERIVRIDDMTGANWKSYGSYGTAGDGPGHFLNPQAVFVAADGRIYVADRDNRRIVRIDDMDGTNWTTLAGFDKPSGVYVAGNGRIYVLDCFSDHIIRIDDMAGTNRLTFSVPFNAVYPPTGIVLR